MLANNYWNSHLPPFASDELQHIGVQYDDVDAQGDANQDPHDGEHPPTDGEGSH